MDVNGIIVRRELLPLVRAKVADRMTPNTSPRWIELRAHGRMWGRYNPHTQEIEFARQDVRVVFDLRLFQAPAQGEKENTLQPAQPVLR